eukprot:2430979-Prymnesium_polylepis.1
MHTHSVRAALRLPRTKRVSSTVSTALMSIQKKGSLARSLTTTTSRLDAIAMAWASGDRSTCVVRSILSPIVSPGSSLPFASAER